MIKINLANTLVNKSDSAKGASSGAGSNNARDIVVKLILIFLPLIGIYVYEKTDIDAKNLELATVKQTQETLSADLKKLGSKDDIVQQQKEQEKEMNERKNVMKQIFGLRSKKVSTLTLLQSYIPPACWLKKISFAANKVSIMGFASDIQAAHAYISQLSDAKEVFANISGQDISEEKDAAGNMSGLYKFEFVLELKE